MTSFDDTPANHVFEDRKVLKRSVEYEKPVNQLPVRTALGSIKELLKGGKLPPSLYITAPSGNGKTHFVRYFLEQQEKEKNNQEYFIVWLDKIDNTSSYNVLTQIDLQLDNIFSTSDDTSKSRPRYSEPKLCEQICQRLKSLSKPIVIILDGVTLTDGVQTLLEDVIVPARGKTANPVGLVILSNENQYAKLANCFSNDGPIHITFGDYSPEEISEILAQKAEIAFRSGCVSQQIIEVCAKITIEREATPQEAQELLMRAGDAASRLGETSLSDRHIQKAVSEMEKTTWK